MTPPTYLPFAREVKLNKVPPFQPSHYGLPRLQYPYLRCAPFDDLRHRWLGLRFFPDQGCIAAVTGQ